MQKLTVGTVLPPQKIQTIETGVVTLPPSGGWMHLQFRRFARCPICNLHLRSFEQRHAELVAAGIQEVVVFHSSKESLLEHNSTAPFARIADPSKSLYKQFGVDTGLLSVLHPGAWSAAIRGVIQYGAAGPEAGETSLGLPADFLIDPQGVVVALKYGVHADDQWTVDELLHIAARCAAPLRMA